MFRRGFGESKWGWTNRYLCIVCYISVLFPRCNGLFISILKYLLKRILRYVLLVDTIRSSVPGNHGTKIIVGRIQQNK